MAMKRNASLIFGGLTISALFLWLYLSGYLCGKSVDFDNIVRRGATWKSIIGAMQTSIPQKGTVVRFLCPIEFTPQRGQDCILIYKPKDTHKTTFYDLWVRGGKDYTEFWKKFHDPDNAIFRDSFFSGKAGIDAVWLVNGASFVGDMKREFIDVNNYFDVNFLRGLIFEDDRNTTTSVPNVSLDDLKKDNRFCPSPFMRRLKKADLLNEQEAKYFGYYADIRSCDAPSNTYTFKPSAPFLYNSVKPPDLPGLKKRYRQNLSLLLNSNKVALAKQLESSLKNIKQDEELSVAGINDAKTLLALDEAVKLLEKAGIKEIHSMTAFPENPDREYLCIPVKINAILSYGQLKSLSDAVSNASTLSIIDFFAAINCDLKPTDVKPLLEKGLPFYQARCVVIIEFITKLPDDKAGKCTDRRAVNAPRHKPTPNNNGGTVY